MVKKFIAILAFIGFAVASAGAAHAEPIATPGLSGLGFFTTAGINPDGGSTTVGIGAKYRFLGLEGYLGGPHGGGWSSGGGINGQIYFGELFGSVISPYAEVGGYYHERGEARAVSLPSGTVVSRRPGASRLEVTGGGGLSFAIPTMGAIHRNIDVNLGYNTAQGVKIGLGVTF